MGKIFDVDFRDGSLIDKATGKAPTGSSNISIVQTEKGLAAMATNVGSYLSYDLSGDYLNDRGSMFMAMKMPPVFGSYFGIAGHQDGATEEGWRMYMNNSQPGSHQFAIRSGDGSTLTSSSLVHLNNEFFLLEYNRRNPDDEINYYINGIQVDQDTPNFGDVADLDDLRLFDSYTTTNAQVGLQFLFVKIFDHQVTEKERAKLYQEFLHATPITKAII